MNKLGATMKKFNYLPELIFNMDETMLDASRYKIKVIFQASASRLFTLNEIKKEHTTLGLCITAVGSYLKPLTILSFKTLSYLL